MKGALEDRLVVKHATHLRCLRWWRRAVSLKCLHVPLLPGVIMGAARIVFGAELPMWREVPRGLILMHNARGVVIHPSTVFLGPSIVFHQVTFGNSWSTRAEGAPVVGRYTFVGAGAKVLGRVEIGDLCIVAANAVVSRDVPSGHMAIGNPMQLRRVNPFDLLKTCFDVEGEDAVELSRGLGVGS